MNSVLSILKLSFLTALLLASWTTGGKAQTYIVNLGADQADAYNGNATKDFGVSAPYTVVGGAQSDPEVGDTWQLGSATLKLVSMPSDAAAANHSDPSDNPSSSLRLTFHGIYAESSTPPVVLTLTGVKVGDKISIAAIGGISPNHGQPGSVVIRDGKTSVQVGSTTASEVKTDSEDTPTYGTGTFGIPVTFTATSDTYKIEFATTQGEGNISGLLVTDISGAKK